jgi:chromosome partitioning protein
MTVISIANQKGGVGKTATAINLSSAIAERGKRVLLIDLDPQGNATISLGFNRREVFVSIYEVLLEGVPVRSAIFPTVVDNLSMLPANENMPGAEVELIDLPGRAHILKNAIEEVRYYYDYIFIDCPPSLGILTLNALTASDGLLVTMQAEFLALEGLSQLLKTVNIVREQLNPKLGITGVLFTMYDARTRLTREVEDEVRSFFEGGSKVFNTAIPRTVRLAEAPSHGLPITLYAPSSNGADAYRDLASEVINATETRTGKGIESPYPGTGRDSDADNGGRTEPWDMGQGDPCVEDIPESPPAA